MQRWHVCVCWGKTIMGESLRAYRRLGLFKNWMCQSNQNQKMTSKHILVVCREVCVLLNVSFRKVCVGSHYWDLYYRLTLFSFFLSRLWKHIPAFFLNLRHLMHDSSPFKCFPSLCLFIPHECKMVDADYCLSATQGRVTMTILKVLS